MEAPALLAVSRSAEKIHEMEAMNATKRGHTRARARSEWRARRVMAFSGLMLAVTGCDGGFLVRGTVVSRTSVPLEHCSLDIRWPSGSLICCAAALSPPKISTMFLVPPFSKKTYTLTLSCPGFRPYVVRVRYGQDASPRKPLELGVITLEPEPGGASRPSQPVSPAEQ